MAFGLSGSGTSSQMEGADAVVAYVDDTKGYAIDYNITAKAPVRKYKEYYLLSRSTYPILFLFYKQCGKVLGQYKGVCRDELFGALDNNQLYTAVREDGISIVTYRRTLNSCKSLRQVKEKRKKQSGII